MNEPASQEASQEPVFALLADPATHPAIHGWAAVERIDTHAASVFLAGDRAFKVKRAVRFPFLDYSTLDNRKRACEAELEVNRAFAQDIYLRVVPITRAADGRLALDGDGLPVEWAVEMRRSTKGHARPFADRPIDADWPMRSAAWWRRRMARPGLAEL